MPSATDNGLREVCLAVSLAHACPGLAIDLRGAEGDSVCVGFADRPDGFVSLDAAREVAARLAAACLVEELMLELRVTERG
jgi:hypothetical protein